MLTVPVPDLRAAATGESILLFVDRGVLAPGDMVQVAGGEPRAAEELAPAYGRWAALPCPGTWRAEVVAVHAVNALDPDAAGARHVLAALPPGGDVALVRVSDDRGPVLGDEAFAARRASLAGALR
jgi:hypothetical protein